MLYAENSFFVTVSKNTMTVLDSLPGINDFSELNSRKIREEYCTPLVPFICVMVSVDALTTSHISVNVQDTVYERPPARSDTSQKKCLFDSIYSIYSTVNTLFVFGLEVTSEMNWILLLLYYCTAIS